MRNRRIYFDHASATPIKAEAIERFIDTCKEHFANASSIHTEGEKVREFLEKIRKDFSFLLRAKKSEVYFVGSSTEANNIFIQGIVKKEISKGKKPHIISSLAEHSSILEPILSMERLGAEVTYITPNIKGKYLLSDIKNALKANTVLIAISSVSSENGTIQNVREIAITLEEFTEKIKESDSSFEKPALYIDATQGVEYDTVDVGTLKCDGMTFGARKLGGLGGVAVLYIKNIINIEPIIFGGGQESGLRSGTENVALIKSFYEVSKSILQDKVKKKEKYNRVTILKKYLVENLEKKLKGRIEILGDIKIKVLNNSSTKTSFFQNSTPQITMLHIPNILGEELVLRLDAKGIAVSTSSACSILEGSGSHFLNSLQEFQRSKETIRVSFGYENTFEEIDYFVNSLKGIIDKYQNVIL